MLKIMPGAKNDAPNKVKPFFGGESGGLTQKFAYFMY